MKEIDEKTLKEIYLNVLKAIIIVLYFFILNKAYKNVSSELLERGIQIFAMVFLFIAIYIFEKAYKKDDGKLAIQGIEILVLATYTLTTRHITNKFNFDFESYSLVASYTYAIYFILKGIVVYTKRRKEMAENLSDIREIVKKDEPVKKEAIKKNKKQKDDGDISDNKVDDKNTSKIADDDKVDKKDTNKVADNKDKKDKEERNKKKKSKKEVKEND